MTTRTDALAPFRRRQTILLTTYRADGSGVGTPVSIAVDGERAYVRTYDQAFKVGRLRADPSATIAPSTVRGVPTGPPLAMRARLLDGDEAAVASRALARKHPLLHGLLVPLAHRLRGYRTLHYELIPAGPADEFDRWRFAPAER
jgi:uncharacterized protein